MKLKVVDILNPEEKAHYDFWRNAMDKERTVAGVYYCSWKAKKVLKKAERRYLTERRQNDGGRQLINN